MDTFVFNELGVL